MLKIALASVFMGLLFLVGCWNDTAGSVAELPNEKTIEMDKVDPEPSQVIDLATHSTDSVSETIKILEGSVARYKIGEVLTRYPNPIVAVGESDQVTGAVVFDENGQVLSGTLAVDVSVVTCLCRAPSLLSFDAASLPTSLPV